MSVLGNHRRVGARGLVLVVCDRGRGPSIHQPRALPRPSNHVAQNTRPDGMCHVPQWHQSSQRASENRSNTSPTKPPDLNITSIIRYHQHILNLQTVPPSTPLMSTIVHTARIALPLAGMDDSSTRRLANRWSPKHRSTDVSKGRHMFHSELT